ncbi:MAG: pyruvate ferredoxin oxidoreductase [Desulfobacterota bacterium]|nr:pyruvate ferredoxin oxidoreductase [Thermodesulfobacteriota bacterium]
MARRVGAEGSFAVADAVRLADVDVVAAYPITPQTHVVERLSEMVAEGELNANYMYVESEHSAISACLGAAAVGARTFTSTAGQGLELMHEVLYLVSSMRLPVVMAVSDRALSGPLNVWGDHSDVMAVRDVGWIQYFVENAQEAHDLTLCAFRIAEDPHVLFPVMVHMDGFHVSHVVEPYFVFERDELGDFLPAPQYPYPLDPNRPVTMGAFGPPAVYAECRKAQDVAINRAYGKIVEVWEEFGRRFGRTYRPLETYKTEDAETVLVAIGSFNQMAAVAVDRVREKGRKVGLVRLRLWRPFPLQALREAVQNAREVIVFERAMTYGGSAGPLCTEVKSALYGLNTMPRVLNFIGGLGGRDMSVRHYEAMFDRAREIVDKGIELQYETIGVRG